MVKETRVRMKWNTFLRLKRQFPAQRGESAAHYFERLAKWLEKRPVGEVAGQKIYMKK